MGSAQFTRALFIALSCLITSAAFAEESAPFVPQPGKFPPAGTGTYLAGELVIIDHANRRGGLRLDGDGSDRYHVGPLHYFAMLPYGTIRYHGAPAELQDIPLGTHVHGYFYVPPIGEEDTIPPLPEDMKRFTIPQNHAVSLDDDFSFYGGRGQNWKVESLDFVKGKIHVSPVGKVTTDGINTPFTFDIDDITKVWKGRTLVELLDIPEGQIVQLNLGWCPGWRDKEFKVTELWLDDESRTAATDRQRRRHVKYQQQRWLPAWIDSVEDFDYGGGIVTLTLFDGMDPSLYADLKATQSDGFGVAVAEKTMRTWFHRSDKKIGQVIGWTELENPPPGSSGIQVRLKFAELLNGYRPGRSVRVKCHNWTFVTMPTEERVKSIEDRDRSEVFRIP